MQWSRDIGPFGIENVAVNISGAFIGIWPPNAMHGIPALRARRATSYGAFPPSDYSSIFPSPVITNPAFASSESNPIVSNTNLLPSTDYASQKAHSPAVMPPAAAPDTRFVISFDVCWFTSVENWVILDSKSSTMGGVAPFCGPNIIAAPVGPRRGYFTSETIISSQFFIRVSKELTSIEFISFSMLRFYGSKEFYLS